LSSTLWEPNSPEKQKPAEGRALHPVEPGKLCDLAVASFLDNQTGRQAVIFR
jgi:hypothetical protein